MATGTTTSNSSISDLTGYCTLAVARPGSNGLTTGDYECSVGGDSGSPATGRVIWDNDLTDGFSSGELEVMFTAEAGGGSSGVNWQVPGASPCPVIYTGRTYGAIQKVQIRAAVQTTAQMQWSNVLVKFLRLGRLMDQYSATTGPAVDTSLGGLSAEQILEVVPDFETNTKVIVTASMLLASPVGVALDIEDILAQIFVYSSSCSDA